MQGADVTLEFLGGLPLRGAGVVSGLGRAPGCGTSPRVAEVPRPGQDNRAAQDQAGRDRGQQGGLQQGDRERFAGHGDQELGAESQEREVRRDDDDREHATPSGVATGDLEAQYGCDRGNDQDERDEQGPGGVEAEGLGGPVQRDGVLG